MLAVVTSIGEPTTDLCIWSLQRNGFTVKVIRDPYSSLWEKLKHIYIGTDEDFLRVDADVIPNRKVTASYLEKQEYVYDLQTVNPAHSTAWWLQFSAYDWFQQDVMHGGIQFIRKEALPALRAHVDEFERAYRPETYLYRLEEFTNPIRRCVAVNVVAGLHGFAQTDIERVKDTKERRGQMGNYDFELAERLNNLIDTFHVDYRDE